VLSSILILLITQSVDKIVLATEAAFIRALLVTNKGSIIPDLTIFTIFPVTTSIPSPSFLGMTGVNPAFSNIILNGANIACVNIFSEALPSFILTAAFNNAIPPPGTIPSFIAAFVAQIASSTLSCFSFSSISEFAPTFTIATLAANLANLLSRLIVI